MVAWVILFVKWFKLIILQDEHVKSSRCSSLAADWVKYMKKASMTRNRGQLLLILVNESSSRDIGIPIRSQLDSAVAELYAVKRRDVNIVSEAECKLAEHLPCLLVPMRTAVIESVR